MQAGMTAIMSGESIKGVESKQFKRATVLRLVHKMKTPLAVPK